MPNPGKPAELKKKLGSRHYSEPHAEVELFMAEEVPEPLRRLEDSGLRLWTSVWSKGKIWISPRTDVELVQITCEQLDERDILRSYVMENMDAWHERAALRQLEKDIASNLGSLGFSPADRTKLGLAEVKTMSKIEEMRAAREF